MLRATVQSVTRNRLYNVETVYGHESYLFWFHLNDLNVANRSLVVVD